MNVKIKKGGRGKIGERVRAPGGKYIHVRKRSPKNYTKYITKATKKGKKIRLGWNPKKRKWEVQSILTPFKK